MLSMSSWLLFSIEKNISYSYISLKMTEWCQYVCKRCLCFVIDAKRLIGRKFDDPSVQSDMKHWSFTVINDGGKPKIQVEYKSETKTFSPEEVMINPPAIMFV